MNDFNKKQNFINTAEKLLLTKARIAALLRQEQAELEELKKICNYQSTSIDGYVFEKHMRLGSIKYENIEVLKTIDLNLYRGKEVEVWRIKKEIHFEELI